MEGKREVVKEGISAGVVVILVVAVLAFVSVMLFAPADFVGSYLSLAKMKFFAPKVEAVQRETFEQSKAYRQGNAQELQNLRLAYMSGDDLQKKAIADTVIHRTADTDMNSLNPTLRAWVESINRGNLP